MYIKRATRQDLPAVLALSKRYPDKLFAIKDYLFNSRDIALQARTDTGELVGFIWGGLMAGNRLMYIDMALVDPEYVSLGVFQALAEALELQAQKRGVKSCFAVTLHDAHYPAVCKAALKRNYKSSGVAYTGLHKVLGE